MGYRATQEITVAGQTYLVSEDGVQTGPRPDEHGISRLGPIVSWDEVEEASSQEDAELSAIYRELLTRGRAAATARRKEIERRARVKRCKGHGAASTSEPRPYTGAVNPRDENPMAHGNIEVTERCRCGAERRVLINQRHCEHGSWY